jgi:hypothetical protein
MQAIQKIEIQLGQLADTLSRREEGKLPSQLVANPKGQYIVDGNTASSSNNEQVQAITVLMIGKEVDNKVAEKKDDQSYFD